MLPSPLLSPTSAVPKISRYPAGVRVAGWLVSISRRSRRERETMQGQPHRTAHRVQSTRHSRTARASKVNKTVGTPRT